jgi:hypothetical protein
MTTSEADPFALPRLSVRRATTMSSFAAMITGQDTRILQWDRVLTRGYAVVRRARATARAAQNSGLLPGASSLLSSQLVTEMPLPWIISTLSTLQLS